MLTIPTSYYLAFETIQNIEEYFEGKVNVEKHVELVELSKQIVILTVHNAKCFSMQWQAFSSVNLLHKLGQFIFTSRDCKNVLVSGYTLGVRGICENFINTAMEELKTKKAWKLLYQSVGPIAFCKLLLDHIILVGLPSGSFYQLSGYPINELKIFTAPSRKRDAPEPSNIIDPKECIKQPRLSRRQKKRMRTIPEPEEPTVYKKKSIEVSIDRSIGYASFSHQRSIEPPPMLLPKNRKELILARILFAYYEYLDILHESRMKRKNYIKQCLEMNKDIKSMSLSYGQVAFFLKEQLKKSIPLEFWGSQHNFDIIFRAIKHFVGRNKNEKISMHEILHQFKIKDCQWLSPASGKASCLVPSDLGKRKTILMQALRWVFHDFISIFIRYFFYVTEYSNEASKLFYFRKDVWYRITQPFITTVIHSNNYHLINPSDVQSLKLGVSNVRIVPKKQGFRLITNLQSTTQSSSMESKPSANRILEPVLQILNFEREQHPESVGSAVQYHQLFDKLKNYKQKLGRLNLSKSLYFVKIDIASCFDTIDQDVLLQSLKDTLKSDKYIYRYIHICNLSSGGVAAKGSKIIGTPDRMESLSEHATKLKNLNRGTIIIDQNRSYSKQMNEILELLEENIKRNVVQIGNNFYQRKRGIPQGSCLSTALCDFFFGAFENNNLSFLKEDSNGLLLRYVDDFLYISPYRYYAQRFLQTMITELPSYGVEVNQDKCFSNLDQDIKEFPWLGYLFNTKNLDVHINVTSYAFLDIQSGTTVEYSKQPGKALFFSQIRSIKHKLQDILVNPSFNSRPTIIRNLHDNFYIAARKLEIHVSRILKSPGGRYNAKFIFGKRKFAYALLY
ncbi:hypothetical protein G6F57_003036 [Rhizopus arrhizus]|uniref:Telomerase reverse transcriptase n=1 Tax=Rhizopus oryzae TaxID=64495 RepID=A0A9P7BVB7_RHIOR|nr:hypothetical protein G6F23_001541 [Rhizopus arrhizus]KAG1427375.1 hypothetical protein G6F58_001051 [Rhizopus delemar]KAG0767487.1 hypothetical protein G6F24_002747 [Rhizopus arrhizus]KAG0794066.1 hypothetical protein G6F21_003147 [Rhizopus arrhizus]KAG0801892.1 hypothetical protein G6F22_000801 [Rhizopus arrhizus]